MTCWPKDQISHILWINRFKQKIDGYDIKYKNWEKENFVTLKEKNEENMIVEFGINKRDKDEELHMQSEIKNPEVIKLNEKIECGY